VRADIAPAPELPIQSSTFSPFTPQEVNPPPLRGSTTYWGTVTYASTLDRERAINVFDGWEWRGHKLVIRPLEAVMNDTRVASALLASASPPPSNTSRPSTGLGSEHGTSSGSVTSSLSILSHLDPVITSGTANADVLLSVLRANSSAPVSGYSSTRSQSPRRPPVSHHNFQSLHPPSQPRAIPSTFASDSLASSPRSGSFLSAGSTSPIPSSSLGKSMAKSHLEKSAAELFASSPLINPSSRPGSHSGSVAGSPFSLAGGVPFSRSEIKSPRKTQFGFESGGTQHAPTPRRDINLTDPSDVPWGTQGKERQPIPEFHSPKRGSRSRSRSKSRGAHAVDLSDPNPPISPVRVRSRPSFHDLQQPRQPSSSPISSMIMQSQSGPHPGPISLPPPAPMSFHQMGQMMPLATPPLPSPYGYPQSPPLYAGHHHPGMGPPMPHPQNQLGLGLPPLTPSMPSFSFMPPSAHTPTYHPQFLSPGLMGTPGAGMMAVMNMSGAFTSIAEHPSALGGITPMATSGAAEEGYFEQPSEYFPPMPPSGRGQEQNQPGSTQSESPLDTDQGSHDISRRPSSSGISTAESELGLHNLRRGSSVATTVDDDAEDVTIEEKASNAPTTLTEEVERMSLERSASDKVTKPDEAQSESMHRSKSVDASLLQLVDPGSSTSPSVPSPEQARAQPSTADSQPSGQAAIGASPDSANAKPKVRTKPHPTFQASEFASIVSGFQGIVPPHAQNVEDRNVDRSGLTPGHGRRASWTPGTEYSSYM